MRLTPPVRASRAEEDGPAGSGRTALVAVGTGLAVYGLATYGYLAFAGRGLSAVDFTPLSVMWTLLNAVGIGLFVPFEQVLARATAGARAAGVENQRAAAHAVRGAGLVVLAVVAVGLAAARPIATHLFAGRVSLVLLLVAAMAVMAGSYLVRGLLSGNGHFTRYGWQLGLDGVLRAAAASVLWVAGVRTPEAYAAILVLAPLAAMAATTPRPGRLLVPGRPARVAQPAVALVALVAASGLSQVLANAGPIVVQLLAGPGESTAAGRFTAVLVVARIPLFAFAAVQAVLLPGLAAMVGAGDAEGLRRRVRTAAVWTGVAGIVGTIGLWALGPVLVPWLFGSSFAAARGVVTLVAASGAAFMLAQVAAQVLLSLNGERRLVVGWGAGLVALVVTCAWPAPIDIRAATALLVGCVVALVAVAGYAWHGTRRWSAGQVSGGDA